MGKPNYTEIAKGMYKEGSQKRGPKIQNALFMDKEVTNMEAKESFINEGEREKILDKISEFKEKFQENSKIYIFR